MSLFKDQYKEPILSSIRYLLSLSVEQRTLIAMNLQKMDREHRLKLSPLLAAIQNDIAARDKTTIASKLVDLGIDRTYSELLVTAIIEQAPTIQYMLSMISRMEDSDFKSKFPGVMKDVFVEHKSLDVVADTHKVSKDLANAMIVVIRDAMNSLARGDASESKLKETCHECGFSNSKIDVFLNTLKINLQFWWNMLVFSNTQNTIFGMGSIQSQNTQIQNSSNNNTMLLQKIEQQNAQILQTLASILKTLKSYTDSTTDNTGAYR